MLLMTQNDDLFATNVKYRNHTGYLLPNGDETPDNVGCVYYGNVQNNLIKISPIFLMTTFHTHKLLCLSNPYQQFPASHTDIAK